MKIFLIKLRKFLLDPGVIVSIILWIYGLNVLMSSVSMYTIGLFALGWVLYVIEENLVHRYVFHLPAPKNKVLYRLLYRLHLGHHDQPYNSHILFTPIWFSLPLLILNVALFSLIGFSTTDAIILIFGGSLSAYLLFEWIHINCHSSDSDQHPIIRHLAKYHSRHHYVDHRRWFSISPGGIIFDKLFGTSPHPKAVKTVKNVNTAGLDDTDERVIYARSKYPFSDDLKFGKLLRT